MLGATPPGADEGMRAKSVSFHSRARLLRHLRYRSLESAMSS
jgi:hypothetical protein